MALEQKRGISITSTVLQFPYHDHVLNLLDTPGHRDFSEDTYRVLAAADAAIMVLDTAKGIEPQTLKLFEVCRDPRLCRCSRSSTSTTVPAVRRSSCSTRSSPLISLTPTRSRGRSGIPGDFRGVVDRRDGIVHPLPLARRAGRAKRPKSSSSAPARRAKRATPGRSRERSSRSSVRSAPTSTSSRFLAGITTPVFVGSALDELRRAPAARRGGRSRGGARTARDDAEGKPRDPSTRVFSGFVFKVQANMDPAHRDRIAFVRVCSGRFERGMVVTHGPTGKPFATKYAHSVFGQERETIDERSR